jgi:hypothetical protein
MTRIRTRLSAWLMRQAVRLAPDDHPQRERITALWWSMGCDL